MRQATPVDAVRAYLTYTARLYADLENFDTAADWHSDAGIEWFGNELLSNLVFEACRSCGDLVGVCGFNSVFERDACDDFG